MVPRPISLGLTVCEKVVIEEGTRNLTLVNTFTKLFVEKFPTPPQQFSLCVALTDGFAEGTIQTVITQLETDKDIHVLSSAIRFSSRTAEVQWVRSLKTCSFPAPGKYQISILIDGEWVASRNLYVLKKGAKS